MTGFWLTIVASVLTFGFGLIYFFRPKFMNYHQTALQKNWDELDPQFQALILALMRAAGGGLIASATAMIIFQLEFNKSHHPWMAWAILIVGGIMFFGALYAMLLVRFRTPGRPPLLFSVIILLMIIAGFLFNLYG